MEIKTLKLGINAVNCYIINNGDEGAIIDPGSEQELDSILAELDREHYNYKYIINTHAHFDHIGANRKLQEITGAQIAVHQEDAEALGDPALNSSAMAGKEITSPPADIILTDSEEIELGNNILKVYHTPGHSPGGIVIYSPREEVLFSGDTIFRGGVGRTDLPGSESSELEKSLEKINKLFSGKVKVYPGHGGTTTIKEFFDHVYPQIY